MPSSVSSVSQDSQLSVEDMYARFRVPGGAETRARATWSCVGQSTVLLIGARGNDKRKWKSTRYQMESIYRLSPLQFLFKIFSVLPYSKVVRFLSPNSLSQNLAHHFKRSTLGRSRASGNALNFPFLLRFAGRVSCDPFPAALLVRVCTVFSGERRRYPRPLINNAANKIET